MVRKPPLKNKIPPPRQRMLAKLKESGLTDKDGKKLNLQPFTVAASESLNLSRIGEGFKIPYYDASGKLLPTFRYRYFDVEGSGFHKGVKLRKYDQPVESPVEIYLPQLVDWEAIKREAEQPVLISEGELKSACATKLGLPTIGLGGVFNFGSKAKFQSLIPSLTEFEWAGRQVYICYDSDAIEKPDVLIAENRLARHLTDRSAQVRVIRIPPDGEKKVGLDDYLVRHRKKAFEKLKEEAEEWAPAAELHQLSERYAIIHNIGMVAEDSSPSRILLFAPETFVRVTEAPRKVWITRGTGELTTSELEKEKRKEASAARFYLEWPARRQYDALTYRPGQPRVTANNELNTWSPSDIVPVAGDTSLFDELEAHLFPDDKERRWFQCWCAAPLQNPGLKLAQAVLVWSTIQGNGKSLMGRTIGRLHGSSNYVEIGQNELDSTFNGWLVGKTFVHGSEVCGLRDSRTHADQLKTLITAEDILVNEKHKPAYSLPNPANFYFDSNHLSALFLSDADRRIAVFNATRSPLPQKFYTRFCKWIDSGGLGMILHKLLSLDLSSFEPKAHAIQTTARAEMIDAGRTDLQAWVHALKNEPESILVMGQVALPWRFATAEDLFNVYRAKNDDSRASVQRLANELAAAGFTQVNDKQHVWINNRRYRLWVLRDALRIANMSLKQIGEEYDKHHHGERKWGVR